MEIWLNEKLLDERFFGSPLDDLHDLHGKLTKAAQRIEWVPFTIECG